jgi:hypothetical protein
MNFGAIEQQSGRNITYSMSTLRILGHRLKAVVIFFNQLETNSTVL